MVENYCFLQLMYDDIFYCRSKITLHRISCIFWPRLLIDFLPHLQHTVFEASDFPKERQRLGLCRTSFQDQHFPASVFYTKELAPNFVKLENLSQYSLTTWRCLENLCCVICLFTITCKAFCACRQRFRCRFLVLFTPIFGEQTMLLNRFPSTLQCIWDVDFKNLKYV